MQVNAIVSIHSPLASLAKVHFGPLMNHSFNHCFYLHFKHATRVWMSKRVRLSECVVKVSNSRSSNIESLKPPYVSPFNPVQVMEWGKLALICSEMVLVCPQRLHQGVLWGCNWLTLVFGCVFRANRVALGPKLPLAASCIY